VIAAHAHNRLSPATKLALGVCVLASLFSCWAIGLRLALGPGANWYAFGYIGDEYFYAQRIQPLIPGTTPLNTINGYGDPNIYSPFFLEDVLRSFLSLTGMDVVTLVWLWRFLFPVALLATWILLARSVLRRRRPWAMPLVIAAGCAALPLMLIGYDLTTAFPPYQGFVHRFPTGIEYPLSMLTFLAAARLCSTPTLRASAAVAAAGAVLIYMRPYLAIPWGLALSALYLLLLAQRRVSLRTVLLALAVLAISIAPWLAFNALNSSNPAYGDFTHRYFSRSSDVIHPQWLKFALLTAAMIGLSFYAGRYRALLLAGATTQIALVFVSSFLPPGAELTAYDRYGSFYLVILVGGLLGALSTHSDRWRGKHSSVVAARVRLALLVAASVGGIAVAVRNARADPINYKGGPYAFVQDDLRNLKAYDWIRANTPPDALFVTDDGYDWGKREVRDDKGMLQLPVYAPDGTDMRSQADLFQIVARRRRVYTQRLHVCGIGSLQYLQLGHIHLATLGASMDPTIVDKLYNLYRPAYVFWQKDRAAVPRGYGVRLRKKASVVYSDGVCEIWKIAYPADGAKFSTAASAGR
jgi:hypothetical protein